MPQTMQLCSIMMLFLFFFKMEYIDASFVQNSFGNVEVMHFASDLENIVNTSFEQGDNVLLMSSGTFQKASFTSD